MGGPIKLLLATGRPAAAITRTSLGALKGEDDLPERWPFCRIRRQGLHHDLFDPSVDSRRKRTKGLRPFTELESAKGRDRGPACHLVWQLTAGKEDVNGRAETVHIMRWSHRASIQCFG